MFWREPPAGYALGPVIGGRAGVTRVFAAVRPNGEPCALKTLDPRALSDVRVARFAHEVAVHVAATGVAGVTAARDPDGRAAWLDLAWAHGGDVTAHVARSTMAGAMLARRADRIVADVLATAALLHDRGIAHRDIKPSNLLIDGDAWWLTDFGIAGIARIAGIAGIAGFRSNDAATGERTDGWTTLPAPYVDRAAGTAPWAAPELASAGTARTVTPASDVYSIGMLWQWLASLDTHSTRATMWRSALRAHMLAVRHVDRPTAGEALALLRARCSDRDDWQSDRYADAAQSPRDP